MKMNRDREWLRKMAELEDGCCVSAGGLPAQMGMLEPPRTDREQPVAFDARRVALARFVEFSRRKSRLSVEQFASRANLDVAEVLQVEDADAAAPEPRVIFTIACFLKADPRKLMELAGHVTPRDAKLQDEAMRFAAWSQGSEPLSQEEDRILGAFARVIVEASDRG